MLSGSAEAHSDDAGGVFVFFSSDFCGVGGLEVVLIRSKHCTVAGGP